MKYPKDSVDYQVNLVAYYEMVDFIPMTRMEHNALRKWAFSGHDVEDNPWRYVDDDDFPMNYLKAYRIKHGASHGPWDTWGDDDESCYQTYPAGSFD